MEASIKTAASDSRQKSKAPPPPPSDEISNILADLPSRGNFSSSAVSSNLGGMRVYVCDHDTLPPEEQVITTNATDILIRTLQMNNQKGGMKDASKVLKNSDKGKRSAGRPLDESTPAKRAKTASSSNSAQLDILTAYFSERALQDMTVKQLQLLSTQRGLSSRGRKNELIARLRNANELVARIRDAA